MIEAEFDNNDYILSYGNKNSTRERGFSSCYHYSAIILVKFFNKSSLLRKDNYYVITAEQEAIDLSLN